MDQIKSNINKTAGLELSNMVKNLNDIDPIVLKLQNMNVKQVVPMPNEIHCFISVEQELFSKKQNTKTTLWRAYYGSDEIEKIGEFIGDLTAIYTSPNSTKIFGFINDVGQNRTKIYSLDHKTEICKMNQAPKEYKIPIQGRISNNGVRRIM